MTGKSEFFQVMRFLAAGISNSLIALGIFSLLYALGASPQWALIVTYLIGVVIAFYLHSRLVFRPQGQARPIAFLAVYVTTYLTNRWLLALSISGGADVIVAQTVLTALSAAMSYTGLSIVFHGTLPVLGITVPPPLGPRRRTG